MQWTLIVLQKKMHSETCNTQVKDVLEGKFECTCNKAKDKFQGLPIATKRDACKIIHILLNSSPVVVRDELRENKQMKRACKLQRKQILSHVRNFRRNNKNSIPKDSCARLFKSVQLRDGT